MKMYKLVMMVLVCSLVIANCAKKSDSTSDSGTDASDDTTTSSLVQSVTDTVSDGMQQTSQTYMLQDIAEQSRTDNSADPVDAMSTACSSVAFSSCSSGVQTRDFNGCTRTSGTSSITVNGTATLTYSDSACSMSTTNNTVTRTLSNHYITNAAGYKVLMYTATGTVGDVTIADAGLKDFNGTTRSGGQTLTKTTGGHKLVINGVHRRGVNASGLMTFWHTIYTDANGLTSVISGSNYKLNGTVNLAHNRVKVLVTNTFTDVLLPSDGSCCYPVGGTITTTVGSQSPVTTTFSSTCGTATVDGTSTTLPACGGT